MVFLMRYTYSSLHNAYSYANPDHCIDLHKKKNPSGSEGCRQRIFLLSCGDEGIRTLDRVSPIHTFQACSFNHSDTSPFFNGRQKYSINVYKPNIFSALAVVMAATASADTFFIPASFSTIYFK